MIGLVYIKYSAPGLRGTIAINKQANSLELMKFLNTEK